MKCATSWCLHLHDLLSRGGVLKVKASVRLGVRDTRCRMRSSASCQELLVHASTCHTFSIQLYKSVIHLYHATLCDYIQYTHVIYIYIHYIITLSYSILAPGLDLLECYDSTATASTVSQGCDVKVCTASSQACLRRPMVAKGSWWPCEF